MERRKNGFTLVELLAVIVVLAIIMVIAIPAVMNSMNKAKKRSFVLYAEKVITAVETKYLTDVNLDNESGARLYNIEKDLGLSTTGNYHGYVAAIPDTNGDATYYITMWDGTYMLVNKTADQATEGNTLAYAASSITAYTTPSGSTADDKANSICSAFVAGKTCKKASAATVA